MRGVSGGFLLACLIASTMLFFALLEFQYSYYILLRLVVCGVAAFGAFNSVKVEKIGWAWILGIIAVLFNPFIRVHLSREIWASIDVISAVIFIISIFVVRDPATKSEQDAELHVLLKQIEQTVNEPERMEKNTSQWNEAGLIGKIMIVTGCPGIILMMENNSPLAFIIICLTVFILYIVNEKINLGITGIIIAWILILTFIINPITWWPNIGEYIDQKKIPFNKYIWIENSKEKSQEPITWPPNITREIKRGFPDLHREVRKSIFDKINKEKGSK